MAKINKNFLKKVKKELISQRDTLLAKSRQVIDVDTDGDEVDEIQGNMLMELDSQLSTRDISKLSQIEDALLRIENNSYGMCEDCEDNIPEKRLLINPYFLTCVSCAEDRELKLKKACKF